MIKDPLALSYGMGVDSTAVFVGWWRCGIRPDWIGHAQVGNEWPETYAYRPVIDAWLSGVGFPTITDVRYVAQRPKNGPYATLEENCLVNETLPSLAFDYKKCSLKWSKFGGAVRSKLPVAQVNEILAKLVCHNLACIVRAVHAFGIDVDLGGTARSPTAPTLTPVQP